MKCNLEIDKVILTQLSDEYKQRAMSAKCLVSTYSLYRNIVPYSHERPNHDQGPFQIHGFVFGFGFRLRSSLVLARGLWGYGVQPLMRSTMEVKNYKLITRTQLKCFNLHKSQISLGGFLFWYKFCECDLLRTNLVYTQAVTTKPSHINYHNLIKLVSIFTHI